VITAAAYGRLGADPVSRTTAAGKDMVTGALAVDVARPPSESDDTEWIGIVAFGAVANTLLLHRKGDLIAAMGRLCRNRFTGLDGTERVSWSLTVGSIVSARTVRPGGRPASPESTNLLNRANNPPERRGHCGRIGKKPDLLATRDRRCRRIQLTISGEMGQCHERRGHCGGTRRRHPRGP
jgi:single-strand DNA-binding protein